VRDALFSQVAPAAGAWPWSVPKSVWACGCCGRAVVDEEFMRRLERLFEAVGQVQVVSGYRCRAANARVTSTGSLAPHYYGRGVDLAVFGQRAFNVVAAAPGLGFTGIGVAQRGRQLRKIHLDDLPPVFLGSRVPRPWVWSCDGRC
jgi:hypothetical protein